MTELVIPSSGIVDLYEDAGMSLNYNIADIKEPQIRNSDYSKTITVPGTNNNNKLLGHIYEIGADRLFNPNHKREAWISYGGTRVFKGYLRLAKIRKLRDDKIEYDLEIKGRLDGLFANIGDNKLTDLTWTDLNHTYSRANVIASWSAAVGNNYVYPFIDYGYSTNLMQLKVDHFFPAVYVKEAWDRVFSFAGFQYSSTFLNSTYFKSLIMPFTSDTMRLTAAQVTSRSFKASRSTTSQVHTPFQTSGTYEYFNNIFNDDSSTGNTDGGNNYNESTGVYTVPATGRYDFVANVSYNLLATPNLPNQYINYGAYGAPRLIVNGVAKVYGQIGLVQIAGINNITTYSTQQTSAANYYDNQYITYSGIFTAGDTVYIDFQFKLISWFTPVSSNNVRYEIELKTGSYFYAKPDPIMKEGDTITFANTLPQDMKIKDFMVSIIKMHNLYFEYDKDTPNKILIEPRNDYYTTTTVDWSDKLDASKEPEIIPMGALNTKRYKFTYKKDEDVLNKTYQTTYGEVYGEKYVDVDNDFVKNTETMEVVFSPTPQYGLTVTNRYYPAMYNVDSAMKIVHNKSMNPRILYYGGLKSCNKWYLFSGNIMGATLTAYPYCGMMDDPETPTISLDFGVPREVYYTPAFSTGYSNNNLYNKYWKQFIDEITDKNSSIVTAWFWLAPSDIAQVDFRFVYHFLGQNFRLNKIYDYNPADKSLTKCEFLKIKQGIPFAPQTKPMGGGIDHYFADAVTRVPFAPSTVSSGGGNPSPIGFTNLIQGQLNYVSPTASNVKINGNSNSVGTDCENIEIINSSGVVVAGGLVNVSVYNSSGVTVTESNTIVENNVVIISPSTGDAGQWIKVGTKIYNGNTGGEVRTNRLTLGNNTGSDATDDRVKINWSSGTDAFIRSVQNVPMKLQAYEGAGEVAVTGDGRFYGLALHNNPGSVTGTTNQYIASGTYTPTLTNVTNISSSTAFVNTWKRVGNVVHVAGAVSITSTAGGLCYLEMSLPIASSFTNEYHLAGVGVGQGTATAGDHLSLTADVTDDRVQAIWSALSATTIVFTYTYQYLIE